MIVALARRLFFGCWIDHDFVRGRTKQGIYVFRCTRCQCEKKILPNQKFKARKEKKKIRVATKPTAVVAAFAGRK